MPQKTAAENLQDLLSKLSLKNEDKINAVIKEMSADDQSALKSSLKVIQLFGDKVTKEKVAELMTAIEAVPAPDTKALKEAQDLATAEKERADKAVTELTALKKEQNADDLLPLTKEGALDLEKIPAHLQKPMQALWSKDKRRDEELAELRTSVTKERDARVLKEYETQAAGYDKLPVDKKELAQTLKEVADASPKAFSALEKILKSANEIAGKGAPLTTATGSDQQNTAIHGQGDLDAEYGQIESAAVAHFAADKSVTKEAAVSKYIANTEDGRARYAKWKENQRKAQRA